MAISWDELDKMMIDRGIDQKDRRSIIRSMRKSISDNEEIASVNFDGNGAIRTTLQPKAKTDLDKQP